MKRREFLAAAAAASCVPSLLGCRRATTADAHASGAAEAACGPGYASPAEAMQGPREKLLYTTALYVGTAEDKPDYLATIDVDPASPTYSQVVHRTRMPTPGDELHHFGWNTCSSCHGDETKSRRYLLVPGLRSSNIHVVDCLDEATPKLIKTIDGSRVRAELNLSAPHTVHCLPSGQTMISMLGDAQGNAPGGFLLLDENFDLAGRWEQPSEQMRFNYDFWYQPRHNVMVSSEWGAPNTFQGGFNPDDVAAGKYGRQLHFWDFNQRRLVQSRDLGEEGWIPLEVRFHHNPDSTHGFVGAALSSSIWHWHLGDDGWEVEKVVQVEPVELEDWPMPVPGLITDIVLSMDDRFLYFSDWLHGDLRQYDVSDPSNPRLAGQLWCGGLLGKGAPFRGRQLDGGPQMLQLSLDGKRLYVTNSLYSSWDNQFYPGIKENGSHLLQIDCDTDQGGLAFNEDFYVDFGAEPDGPARAHEMRYPGGDCTSDIFV